MQTEFDGAQAQKEIDEAAREIADAFCAAVEELAGRRDALIRGFARSLCLELELYLRNQHQRMLNGNGTLSSAGGLLGGSRGESGSQIRGNSCSLIVFDEFAQVPDSVFRPGHGYHVGEIATLKLGPKSKPRRLQVASTSRDSMRFAEVVEAVLAAPAKKNKGPQGHIEPWKRRGRGRK